MIQNDLEQIGVKVIPKITEWTVFLDQVHQHDFEAFLSGWRARMSVDPTSVWHSRSIDELNYVYYDNPQVDRLIEQGRAIMSREQARPVWLEFQELIYQDQPYTFLMRRKSLIFVDRRIKNIEQTRMGLSLGNVPVENYVPKVEQRYQ